MKKIKTICLPPYFGQEPHSNLPREKGKGLCLPTPEGAVFIKKGAAVFVKNEDINPS